MSTQARPTGVTILAVLAPIGGGFGLARGLGLIAGGAALGGLIGGFTGGGPGGAGVAGRATAGHAVTCSRAARSLTSCDVLK